MKIRHERRSYFGMSRDDALKIISELSSVIGLLEGKWERPHSDIEVAIIKSLLDSRETVRKAYETIESPGEA